MECPEHGAMLCYGQHGDIRLYRCELGYARVKYHLSSSGEMTWNVEYEQVTHREIWLYPDGRTVEVKPHTLMRNKDG